MLTKKFIIDFIGNSFYHERLTREIRKQPAMSKSEIRNFVKMELIDLLDRYDLEVTNMVEFEKRVDEITTAVETR